MTAHPDQFALIDYPAMLKAIAARRKELGISQLEADELAGLPQGYTSRLECWKPPGHKSWTPYNRGMGIESMPKLLHVLGLRLMLAQTDIPQFVRDRAARPED